MKKGYKKWLALLLAVTTMMSSGIMSTAPGLLASGETPYDTEMSDEATDQSQDAEAVTDEDNPVTTEQEAAISDTDGNAKTDAEASEEKASQEAAVSMPAQQFSDTASNGVTVNASVAEGVFPAKTKMKVKAIKKAEAEAIASETQDNVKDAVGVDITFFDPSGNEIQPAEGTVTVKLSLNSKLKGDDFAVSHQADNGVVTEVDANKVTAKGATFEGESFSIYVISSSEATGEETTVTNVAKYVFLDADGNEISTQKAKTGDSLKDPKTPEKDGFVFTGWTLDPNQNTPFELDNLTVNDSDSHNVYPIFKEIRYVFFMDKEYGNEKARVSFTKESAEGENVTFEDVRIPHGDNESVVAWKNADGEVVTSVTLGTSDVVLYPVIEKGHFLSFDTGEGATYIAPVFVQAGQPTVRPDTVPTRPGYYFAGWNFTFGRELTADATATATWTPKNDTSYTVIHWKQNANDDKYSFAESERKEGTTGDKTKASAKNYSGFNEKAFSQETIKGDGSTIVNIYYDRNQYYVRFYEYSQRNWREITNLRITAKYGADIANEWPSRKSNRYSAQWGTTTSWGEAAGPFQSGISTMPLNGASFYRVNSSGRYTMNLIYQVESLKGGYVTDHTDSFKSSNNSWSTTKEDHYDIKGFTYTGNVRDGSSFTRVGYTDTYQVTFQYRRNSYDIVFYNNGKEDKKIRKKYQASISDANYNPKRPEGVAKDAIFGGWYDNEQCLGEAYTFNGKTMPAENITLYAKWTNPSYNGVAHTTIDEKGSTIDLGTIEYGSTLSTGANGNMPVVKYNDGKVAETGNESVGEVKLPKNSAWIGWSTKSADGTMAPWDFNTKIYGDIVLYPNYIDGTSYKVTYDSNTGDGTVTDTRKYASGSKADIKSGKDLSKDGYVFKCWNTSKTGDGENYYKGDRILITGDVTLFAVYKEVPKKVSLTLKSNYPAGTISQRETTLGDLDNNSSIKLSEYGFDAPEGYYFDGWMSTDGTKFTSNQTIGIDDLAPTDNVLEAQWKKKTEITVVANSGEFKYDGSEKTVEGFKTLTFTENGQTYTVSGLTAEAKRTDAGDTTVKVTGKAVVKDAAGNDVTSQFNVKTTDGKLTVTKRSVTLTSATDSKEYDGKALTNDTVTVSGDGFAKDEGATYNVTGSQKTVGSSANAFTYTLVNAKTENYNITKTEGTLTVIDRKAKYEITVVANSKTEKYDGTAKSVSGFKTLEFTENDEKYTVSGLTASATGTDAGTYTANVTGTAVVKDAAGNDVTKQFLVKTTNGTLTIEKRNVTLTSATDSKEYDGKALTNHKVTVSGDGFADGEGADYTVTGSQTVVGSSDNTFTYELKKKLIGKDTKPENYNINTVVGTLTVTNRDAKYEITVEANSGKFKYDGTEKTASGLKETSFEVEGNTYTVSGLTAEAKATDAGTYAVNVTGTAVVKDAAGNDVTAQFAVKTKAGELEITKRDVTLTSATASKEYDGTALTNSEVTVSGDGFADGEGAAYSVTGSQTLVGESANAFAYTLNAGTKAENYNITPIEGTLTVTNRDAKYEITVEANSGEFKYDGTEKTVSGFKTTEFTVNGQKYTVSELSASASATDAGEYTVAIEGEATVLDAAGNDVTAQFTVKTVDGKLTINKRSVTLTSATDSKEYDGTALTNGEVTVSGDKFAVGEGASYDVTGSQTVVGSSKNTFTYELNEGTKAENYTIKTAEGTLTVEALPADKKINITINAKSDSVTYDGESHSISGFETLEFTVNGAKFTVSGLSAEATETNVKRDLHMNVDSYTVDVEGTAVVTDAEGNDVTDQFKVNTVAGKLTINPKDVTVTALSYTKTEIQDDPEFEASVEGRISKDDTIIFTIEREAGNTRGNTYALTPIGDKEQGNYTVTYVPGTLTVVAPESHTLTVNYVDTNGNVLAEPYVGIHEAGETNIRIDSPVIAGYTAQYAFIEVETMPDEDVERTVVYTANPTPGPTPGPTPAPTPVTPGNGGGGAVVVSNADGGNGLVALDDVETPRALKDLFDPDNALPFTFMLITLLVVIAYSKMTKKEQEEINELMRKLNM